MTGMDIVREETQKIAHGMIPLAFITFGVLVLCGVNPVRTAASLILGTGYSLLLFRMIGKNAAKAVLYPPEQGTRIVRRGYAFRYLLTGCVIVLAIKLPFFYPLAVAIPLFFPKILIIWNTIKERGVKCGRS